MSSSFETDVFYGRVTEHSAHVYVRAANLPGGEEWSLQGHVRGPFCGGVRTLPLTADLEDMGPGETLLARGVVPDPSTWTPLSPAHYVVTIELLRRGEVAQRIEQQLGLRTLGARERDLRWEARRWVLRGICVAEQEIGDLRQWREHHAVPVVPAASGGLLDRASSEGVLLAVELGVDCTVSDLRRLAASPAVGVAVLPTSCETAASLKSFAPNLLFAQTIHAADDKPAEWADFLLCDAGQPDRLHEQLTATSLPVAAVRRAATYASFNSVRAECDRLQRDLAAITSFAGYGFAGYIV